MASRKEQAAMTRNKIISVTEQLIREIGYESIRISDVAKACNMSMGNFYHYFSSLDDLFDEIDTKVFYSLFDELQPDNSLSVLPRLKNYFTRWIDTAVTQGSSYSYYWIQHYSLKTSSNRVSLIAGHLEQILNDGLEKQELKPDTPVSTIAHTIAFSIFGASSYWGLTDNVDFFQEWRDSFCHVFIDTALAPYLC